MKVYRGGKMRDLRDPGSRKYSRIAEKFTKYTQNISIYSSKPTFKCNKMYTRVEYGIKRLLNIIIDVFGQCSGPFLPQTTAEICYNL